MKKNIYLIVTFTILFLSGFVNYTNFENIIIENLKQYSFAYNDINTQLFDSIKFGFLCGIIPIIWNIIWNNTKTEKFIPKLLSLLVFLTVILSYFLIKISILKSKIDTQKIEIDKIEIKNSLNIESLNLPLHFFLAEVIGLLMIYLILKSKTKNK